MNSNFDKVVDFNEKFGAVTHTIPQPGIIKEQPKLIDLRMNLIREEMRELEDAVKNNDFIETIDALGDILYVVYGFGSAIGVNMDEAFDLIHKSNMSKLCKDEAEATETVKWYKQEFEAGRQPYDSPAYRLSNDGTYYVVFNESSGKILKSIKYSMVDLSHFGVKTD